MQKQPITKCGHEKLEKELHDLKNVQRPKTVKELDIARSHGDLKENAEYHAAKERLTFIDSRINELSELYNNVQVIDPSTLTHDKVMFGSSVTIENLDTGVQSTYTIVGTYESNPDLGLISIQTPLARALLGKKVEDEISVTLPSGEEEFEIVEISFKKIELK